MSFVAKFVDNQLEVIYQALLLNSLLFILFLFIAHFSSPIPPSELEKIQPVRRDTWVTNDQPFLAVDVPTDANYRSSPFYETLSMRVLERKDTEPDESVDPDLLRESTRSPFEPEYTNDDAMYYSAVRNANPSTSRSISNPSINDVDRPISGSSRNTYLNIASNSSTLSEDDHAC